MHEVAVWPRTELLPVGTVRASDEDFLSGSTEAFVAALQPLPGLRVLLLRVFLSQNGLTDPRGYTGQRHES